MKWKYLNKGEYPEPDKECLILNKKFKDYSICVYNCGYWNSGWNEYPVEDSDAWIYLDLILKEIQD